MRAEKKLANRANALGNPKADEIMCVYEWVMLFNGLVSIPACNISESQVNFCDAFNFTRILHENKIYLNESNEYRET